MSKDEIIRMARATGAIGMQSSLTHPNGPTTSFRFPLDNGSLENFFTAAFAAGAAAEREACAHRAGIALLGADRGLAKRVDQAIRARGQS